MGLEVDGSREETLSLSSFAVQNSMYRILPLPSVEIQLF